MRVKIIQWIAKAFCLPYPYFEVLPMRPDEFSAQPRNLIGFPVVMNWDAMQEAMWPRPDRRYRVFVQPDE